MPSQSPVPVNTLLLASVQWNPWAHIQVHTETHKNTHRACTQAHTLKERHPGAFLALLRVRAQEAGTGVGLTSCVPGWATCDRGSGPGVGGASVEGAPRNPGLGEGAN